ncbi:uncharacterized protein LOC141674826 [Apium graveolens]|uniref:uncharacterized protein LOC141674826 n=1 Tax=Apium graveolens TaxID=4045 RepID=UPI003D7A59A6
MSIGADRVKQAKVQNLRAELDLLSMGETKLLNDFCMKLYGLVTNIRVLGETVDETSVVKKLLRAVHSKYVTIASTIEQFGNMEEMMVEDIVARLKAHDERTTGVVEDKGGKLLMTEDEWLRSESPDGKLLLTREEWVKRANRGGSDQRFRRESSGGIRGGRDRSKMRSFNCNILGHFAYECRKPRRDKEQKNEQKSEANLTQYEGDEPALLLTECREEERKRIM